LVDWVDWVVNSKFLVLNLKLRIKNYPSTFISSSIASHFPSFPTFTTSIIQPSAPTPCALRLSLFALRLFFHLPRALPTAPPRRSQGSIHFI
jgi:hypothetical protein